MRWFEQQRQDFIAETLRVFGTINREHLERKFGISTPQASMDFATFNAANPGQMIYDKSNKYYRLHWLPIAQAPRDGTHILAAMNAPYSDHWTFDQCPPCVVHWWANPGEEGFYNSCGDTEEPMDVRWWQPLDAPPWFNAEHEARSATANASLDNGSTPAPSDIGSPPCGRWQDSCVRFRKNA